MGGMAVLEWPLCTPLGYIRHIVPIATSARHSAWCISWGETQRQSIYSDPAYLDGYYDPEHSQPKNGLSAARMAALLTYRSRDSFESRFGRKPQVLPTTPAPATLTPPASPPPPPSAADEAVAVHNDGHRSSTSRTSTPSTLPPKPPQIFSAQSYLRYQGNKFTARFDANCYIHITRKLDSHDLARDRFSAPTDALRVQGEEENDRHSGDLAAALSRLPRGALVISIETDGLFTPSEQKEIAAHIPAAQLVTIPSPEGHDGFLLEFKSMNEHILGFLKARLPELYAMPDLEDGSEGLEGFEITKTSVFGEAEVDVTRW